MSRKGGQPRSGHWGQLAAVAQWQVENRRFPARLKAERLGLRRGELPHFVVLGAMKAGTTMFYDALSAHPDVLPAIKKEVHYFDFNYPAGGEWYRAHLPSVRQCAAHESATGRAALVGEASPTYLYHPLAPRRARATVPDAKLIVLLRNPIDRAYSHYHSAIRHDWDVLPFDDAIEREPARLNGQVDVLLMDEEHHRSWPRYRWSYVSMGEYAGQVENWLRHFPREQFLFVLSEDLRRDTEATLGRVHDFLGVARRPVPAATKRNEGRYPPMAPESREKLRQHFRPQNERLADLLGLDLGWDT